MDNSILKKGQIDSLFKEYITKEELDIYNSKGEDGDWDKGEKYLIAIYKIPFSKEKLQIWGEILNFEDLYPGVKESFMYLEDACNELKNNKHFKLILHIILSLGNILNSNSNIRGQADGFSLDLLPKLNGIKTNKGNNILNYICIKIKNYDENCEKIKQEFPKLIQASEYSILESNKSLSELRKLSHKINENLGKLNNEEQFYIKCEEYNKKFKEYINELEKKSDNNTNIYQETVKFFGYNEKDDFYTQNDKFFKMLLNFFDDIDKAMPKPEAKKKFNNVKGVGKKIINNRQTN